MLRYTRIFTLHYDMGLDGLAQYGIVWCAVVWKQRIFRFPHPIVPTLLTGETAFQFPAQTIPVFFLPSKFCPPAPGWNVQKLANLSTAYFTSGWPCHLLVAHISNRMAPICQDWTRLDGV